MASVTKRGNTWQYTVSRYIDGKYSPIRKGGFKTKKEAKVAALDVGLRYGELVGLTVNACDFINNTIYVFQAWDYNKGTGFTTLKNTPSERTIPVDPEVMAILKQSIDNDTEINEHGLLFHSVGKVKVVTNNAANKQLARLIKNLNISTSITCHGLRHTHASVLLHEGFNIQYVSERLGHETVQTTMSTYAHILKELRAKEDENIFKLYKPEVLDNKDNDV